MAGSERVWNSHPGIVIPVGICGAEAKALWADSN